MLSFKTLLNRFARSYVTMDLRSDLETRKLRCKRFMAKNKTNRKPATFAIGPAPNVTKLPKRDDLQRAWAASFSLAA